MSDTRNARRFVAHPAFSLICVLLIMFVVPRWGAMATTIGCASLLSVYVALLPERFRDRRGSLRTANCLVAWMWGVAAVCTAMMLSGAVHS